MGHLSRTLWIPCPTFAQLKPQNVAHPDSQQALHDPRIRGEFLLSEDRGCCPCE